MSIGKFLLLTTVGTAIWNVVLVNLGALMGNNWGEIVEFMDTYSTATMVILAVGGVAVLVWFFKFRKTSKTEEIEEPSNIAKE